MSTERVDLAVVGLGDIARKAHLPVLAARSDVNVVGLVSRSGRGAAELTAQYRFPIQASTLDQVIDCHPAGALVLTASESHPELTCRLLEAGIAVYLEKPMAVDVAGARLVAACAQRTGQLLMVGFNRRYAPFYQQMHGLFPAQAAGLCHLIKTRQAGGLKQSPTAAVWDDVIHLIDLSRWLMGDPQQVHASVRYGAEGEFVGLSVQLEYLNGRAATLAHLRAGGVQERVEMYSTGLSARVEDMEMLQTQRDGITQTQTHGPWSPMLTRRGFTSALDHFLHCLRSGQSPLQSAQDALKSHELAQTILDAAGV